MCPCFFLCLCVRWLLRAVAACGVVRGVPGWLALALGRRRRPRRASSCCVAAAERSAADQAMCCTYYYTGAVLSRAHEPRTQCVARRKSRIVLFSATILRAWPDLAGSGPNSHSTTAKGRSDRTRHAWRLPASTLARSSSTETPKRPTPIQPSGRRSRHLRLRARAVLMQQCRGALALAAPRRGAGQP